MILFNVMIGWKFDNSYAHLNELMMTKTYPVYVKNPKLVVLNYGLAKELGLDFSNLTEKELADLFAGNQLPEGSEPLAQAYAGHQFGHLSILGDGRAIVLGEHITPTDERFDIQFKGSGRTAYSRGGDGRAALGPMLREYIISEAMYYLNIKTTRSLAVATTGEIVIREKPLKGAVLTRVARSHIRVGTFEYIAIKKDLESLKNLLNYCINRHYPELKIAENKASAFLTAVLDRQIQLITDWMRVGFIHGVMNTDNMAISGETIDYGPCAFMDTYNPETVFSSIDEHGRYAFQNQPGIAQWNLARLAEALVPLLDKDQNKAVDIGEEIIGSFNDKYKKSYMQMMKNKLGIFESRKEDEQLIQDLLNLMFENKFDYTNTFISLMHENNPEIFNNEQFKEWHKRWSARLITTNKPLNSSREIMKQNNPVIIPRNHKVEEALRAANVGDLTVIEKLLSALEQPYLQREDIKMYQTISTDMQYKTFCGT
jgi:serine/tyrosine/threonine adenylyltransferase